MRFRSLLLPLLAFIVAVLAYRFTTELAIAYLWLPQPTWWNWQASRVVTAMTWMHVAHGIGMLAGALPVALALRLLPLRRPVVVAAGMALVALVLPSLWLSLPEAWGYSARMQWSMASDLVKFAGVLPLLTWMLPAWRRPPREPVPTGDRPRRESGPRAHAV